MKKYLSILMVIAVLFSFAACSNNAKIMDLKQQQIQQTLNKQKVHKKISLYPQAKRLLFILVCLKMSIQMMWMQWLVQALL